MTSAILVPLTNALAAMVFMELLSSLQSDVADFEASLAISLAVAGC